MPGDGRGGVGCLGAMTNSGKGPLDGVAVVEITSIYSGPYAGMMWGGVGAGVGEVEGPDQPDPVRAGLGSDPGSVNSIFYALNPRLIDVAINGYGSEGPEADLPVFDYVVQARTGMVDYQRDADGKGDLTHQVIVDKTSANAAVQAVLAALYTRERTNRGQQVEIPMIGVGLHFSWSDAFAPAWPSGSR